MKKLIERDQWGYALHTALRKCCDSHQTTIAYICVREMHSSWSLYLKHLGQCDGTWETLKEMSLSWDSHAVPKHESDFASILGLSFKLFSDNDWKAYGAYLLND